MQKRSALLCWLLILPLLTAQVLAQSGVRPKPRQTAAASELVIPAGTLARIELQTQVNSKLNEVGDEVSALLVSSIFINGELALKKGSEFRGRITQISAAQRPQRQASMTIAFDHVVLPGGAEAEVATVIKAIDDYANESKMKGNDEGKTEGGHSGGKTVDNAVRGIWIGSAAAPIAAAAGSIWVAVTAPAAGAAAGVLLTKGNDIRLFPGTIFRIEFTGPLKVSEPVRERENE